VGGGSVVGCVRACESAWEEGVASVEEGAGKFNSS
jgi:hypothetical protein